MAGKSFFLLFFVLAFGLSAPVASFGAEKVYCRDLDNEGKPVGTLGPCECTAPYGCAVPGSSMDALLAGKSKLAYFPLAPIPGVTTGAADLPAFLGNLFKLLVAASAALAVLMIVIGGFEYLATVVPGSKEAGRQRITNALVGLGILLASYLLIRAVNPELLNFRLLLEPINIAPAEAPVFTSSKPPANVTEAKREVETSSTADAQKARDRYLTESRGAQESADEEAKKLYAQGFTDDKTKDRSLQYYPHVARSPSGTTLIVNVHRYFLKHQDGRSCVVTPDSSSNGAANVKCN